MPATIEDQMHTASRALAGMDYARCEALCLDALDRARADEDWVMVRRVLLPLQEARRQKRQHALDSLARLGVPAAPAHRWMQASEALGDAAIDAIDQAPGTPAYFDALRGALDTVGDHEILHQRMADAAKALHEATR